MKTIVTILSISFISMVISSASSAMASKIVKTCSFVVKMPENNSAVPTTYQIIQDGNNLIAKTTQLVNGKPADLPIEDVLMNDFSVRPGITTNTLNMNQAEQLIAGTDEFLKTPDVGAFFSVGVNLTLIRHARVYQIGKFTHMGGSAIIEARDENGKDLGSFVTGFMPFACEK